jgi:hypothetical protein
MAKSKNCLSCLQEVDLERILVPHGYRVKRKVLGNELVYKIIIPLDLEFLPEFSLRTCTLAVPSSISHAFSIIIYAFSMF